MQPPVDILKLAGTTIRPKNIRIMINKGLKYYLAKELPTWEDWSSVERTADEEARLLLRRHYASNKFMDTAPSPDQIGDSLDGEYHWPQRPWALLRKVC